jgi:hypothetical protein
MSLAILGMVFLGVLVVIVWLCVGGNAGGNNVF